MSGAPYAACVVGLGAMGMGAALACVRAGIETYGVDPRPKACAALVAGGGAGAAAEGLSVAGRLDAALVLTVTAAQARAALFGAQGLATAMRPGAGVMVSATMSAADARAIAADLAARGLLPLDAPVSGGPARAAEGAMTVMAAGSAAAFDRLAPLLDAVAGRVFRISETPGDGSTVKIVHQLLAGVHIAAGAEAMALAARAGIPLDVMYEVVTNAAGNSWMFENRMRRVVDGDYAPRSAVDIFVKDLGLVAETALALRQPTPLASAAYAMFATASAAGWGGLDDSAVIRVFPGVDLPGIGEPKS